MVLLAHHLLASAAGVNCFFEVVPALLAQKRKEKAVCSHPSLPSSAMVTKHRQGSTSFQQDGKMPQCMDITIIATAIHAKLTCPWPQTCLKPSSNQGKAKGAGPAGFHNSAFGFGRVPLDSDRRMGI